MEQNFLNKALAIILECEPSELKVLYKFDTELGKEVSDLEFALQSHSNLNKIVYRLMGEVKVDVVHEAIDILNGHVEDASREEIFADNNIKVANESALHDRLEYLLFSMPNAEKFLYGTELDKTVDFDLSVRDNAINLIKYLVKDNVKKSNKSK